MSKRKTKKSGQMYTFECINCDIEWDSRKSVLYFLFQIFFFSFSKKFFNNINPNVKNVIQVAIGFIY